MQLHEIEVFSELSEKELANVGEMIEWQNVSKNTILFSNNDRSDSVYFIQQGIMRATIYSMAGKEVTYQNLSAGAMFGELSAIDGDERTTSMVAVSDATVGRISSEDFWKLLEKYPRVTKKVMLRLTGLVRFLVGRIYEYAAMDVKNRVRAEIVKEARLNMTGENSARIEKMSTHEDIASKIATHREAVTKQISYLVKNGYIIKQGKTVIVPDLQRLIDLIDEDV